MLFITKKKKYFFIFITKKKIIEETTYYVRSKIQNTLIPTPSTLEKRKVTKFYAEFLSVFIIN